MTSSVSFVSSVVSFSGGVAYRDVNKCPSFSFLVLR